jgi:HEAT repeat protein
MMPLFGPPNIENLKARRDINGLIKALSDQKDAQIRLKAVKVLGEIGDANAWGPLVDALDDNDRYVRNAAADVLGNFSHVPAVEEQVSKLRYKLNGHGRHYLKSPYIRCRVVKSLGKIGNASAWWPLVEALDDHDHDVRKVAADVLGKFNHVPAVEELLSVLNNKRDWHGRRCIIEQLGNSGDLRAVEPLIEILNEKAQDIRIAAVQALSKLGGSRTVEALISALADSNSWIGEAAARSLIMIGTPAVEHLIAALMNNNRQVSQLAIKALGEIGDPRAIEPLIDALSAQQEIVRIRAAESLGMLSWQPGQDENGARYWIARREWKEVVELGAPSVGLLIAALDDSSWYVRYNAAMSLVAMYHRHHFDDETKQQILAVRTKMGIFHSDYVVCNHPHHDEGIGVNFPL